MRSIDIPKTEELLTNFIKTAVVGTGFKRAVVAVSGGVDSACVVNLAVKALGKENVFILLLPYKDTNPGGAENARLVAKFLQVPEANIIEFNIGKAVDELSQSSVVHLRQSYGGQVSLPAGKAGRQSSDQEHKIRAGNIMARVRMIRLFDQAKKLHALVLGTENKSEHMLGYFTRFGDEASDIEPLRNLYKTEVIKLASYIGVPKEIINQPPTAGLWPGQTDEGEFGFTYKEADVILWVLYGAKLSEPDLIKQGIKPELIAKVKAWVKKVAFKHHLPHIAPEPIIS